MGFAGPDCAIVVPVTTAAPTEANTANSEMKMEKKETQYGKLLASKRFYAITPLLHSINNFPFLERKEIR